jgi:hypothetical protein
MMNLTQRQVKAIIDRWRKILHLESNWHITFQIRNSSNEMSEGNQDAMACIVVDLRYFIADIEFNAPEINEADLEAVVLHELLHIIIEPLSTSSGCGLGKKFEEMNSIFTESTIEKLMPGYLHLYNLAFKQKATKNRSSSKKASAQAIRCRRKA